MESRPIRLAYPLSIHWRFRIIISLTVIYFFWGFMVIDDPGWGLLGTVIFCVLLLFYYFRIRRDVIISNKNIIERIRRHDRAWLWKESAEIVIRCRRTEETADSRGLRRIFVVHLDGREISIDSNMVGFLDAENLIRDIARQEQIQIQMQYTIFPMMPFW